MIVNHGEVSLPIPKWILDSGASAHMSPDALLFTDMRPIRGVVHVGNGAGIPRFGVGSVSLLISLPGGLFKCLVLSDVLYVPGLMKALFSWSALKKRGGYYIEDKGQIFIRKFVNDEIFYGHVKTQIHIYSIYL
jgi:hypothetical protein